MKNKKPSKNMRRDSFLLLMLLCALMLFVNIGALVKIIFINGEAYRAKAKVQQTADTTLTAPRGMIYDRNMNVLAQSAISWTCYATPKNIKDDETRESIAKYLSELLKVDYKSLMSKLSHEEWAYATMKKQVTAEERGKIKDFLSKNKYSGMIYFTPSSMRYYPKDNFCSTVLGFINGDEKPATGVELMYDDTLTGTPGRIITAKDSMGNSLSSDYETVVDAQQGQGLILTIDSNIQYYLEKALTEGMEDFETKGAYGIVMEVKTGAVLAMSSKPDYDSNDPYTITDSEILKTLSKIKDKEEYTKELNNVRYSLWNNKTISYLYEPGSVFKIFTLAAGLEEGVVSEKTSYCCTGVYNIGGWNIHCARRTGHGTQTLRQGLMNSCNPFFITVGQRLGTEKYFKYFEAFGFTEKTGIDLPGEATPVAGVTYHAKESFTNVNLASTSFGQTVKISPIQIITAACAIANGGKLMKPYVVAGTVDSDGNILSTTEPVVKRQVISETTAKTVCSMMESVVSGGTGKNAYIAGYRVAGKTATSQKIQESNESGTKMWSGSFVCFAPADDPEIAILVVMDEPQGVYYGGSVIAAPVAKQVMENALVYLNIEPEYTDKELATVTKAVPNLVGSKVSSAKQTAANQGYSAKVVGSGSTVLSQTPKAKQLVPSGGVIVLYTDKGENSSQVEVPDFTGKTVSQVNKLAVSAGLNITFSGPSEKTGSMRSYKQSIAAGETALAGSSITVYFREVNGVEDTAN